MHKFEDIELFVSELFPNAKNIALLGKGGHSHAYSFDEEGQKLVIRFSRHSEDFEKDLFANRFDSVAIPVPKLIKIGDAFGGYFAISEQRDGLMFDDLDTDQIRRTLPSIFKLLDGLREADISDTVGFGAFDVNGVGGSATWSEHLLDSLEDNPTKRTHGWYKILQESKYGTKLFDDGLAVFKNLTGSLPNVRHLIHYDLLNRNVLVNDNEITAVFDWGCGRYGDFLFELACFTFWSPIIDGYRDFDWKTLARNHFESNGTQVSNFEIRLMTYELFIGLEHLGYNAFIGGWENYEKTQDLVTKILENIRTYHNSITIQ